MEGQQNNQQGEQQNQNLGNQMLNAGKQIAKDEVKKKVKKVGIKIAIKVLPYIIVPLLIVCGVYIIIGKVIETINDIKSMFVQVDDNGFVATDSKELLKEITEELEKQGITLKELGLGDEEQTETYLHKFVTASQSTRINIYT